MKTSIHFEKYEGRKNWKKISKSLEEKGRCNSLSAIWEAEQQHTWPSRHRPSVSTSTAQKSKPAAKTPFPSKLQGPTKRHSSFTPSHLMATFLSSKAAAAAMARSAIQHRRSPVSFTGSRLRASSSHHSSPPASSLRLGFSQVRVMHIYAIGEFELRNLMHLSPPYLKWINFEW
jgi:hypothetical protein